MAGQRQAGREAASAGSGVRGRRNTLVRTAVAAALALGLALAIAPDAQAGVYKVYNCGAGVGHNAGGYNSPENDMYLVDNCTSGGWMQTQQRVESGAWSAKWWSSAWGWTAPSYTNLINVTGTSSGRWTGYYWGVTRVIDDWGNVTNLNQPCCGSASWSGASIPSWGGTAKRHFQAYILCVGGQGHGGNYCEQGWSPAAFVSVAGLTFHIDDWAAPGASQSGGLVSGGWKSGTQGVSFAGWEPAYSGSGVRYLRIEVNGNVASQQDFLGSCNSIWSGSYGTTMQPCPGYLATSASLNTAASPFREGANSVRACAIDFSGGYGCSGTSTVYVDNSSPSSPVNLKVEGGEDWRSTNSFTARWQNPTETSGVAGARYRITRVGGGYDSGALYRAGSNLTSLTLEKELPSPGAYELKVWLQDSAGHHNEGTAISSTLRFDDEAPGFSAGLSTPWKNREDFPLRQTWQRPSYVPISAVQGYSIEIDRVSSTVPDLAIEHGGLDGREHVIADLPDGMTYFHVAAVSGARVMARDIEHLPLRVDKVDPVTDAEGVPTAEWETGHVTVKLTPRDPRPENDADPSGPELVEYRIDGGETEELHGGGSVDFSEEGVYRLEFRSIDVAGNREAWRQQEVRIDHTAPLTRQTGITNGWATDDVAIGLEATDALSGPGALRWSVDGGPEQESTRSASIKLRGDGTHTLSFQSADVAGNVEDRVEREVMIDSTPPTVSVEGVPGGWSNQPASITISAADATSGMAGDPANVEAGAHTAVRVGSESWQKSAGDRATTALSADGVHTLSYYARDLAGKAAPVATRVVRIDRTAPAVLFAAEQSPDDPELIRATVADGLSGVAGGEVQYRGGGDSEWATLPTELRPGTLVARFPSDDLPRGRYELRAIGRDGAGNATVTSRRAGGGRMELRNPVKIETRLTATLATRSTRTRARTKTKAKAKAKKKKKARKALSSAKRNSGKKPRKRPKKKKTKKKRPAPRFAYWQPPVVTGTLRTAAGTPIRRVTVIARVSGVEGATGEPRSHEARTDDRGRFQLALPAGPSRRVSLRFGGTRTLAVSDAPALGINVVGYTSLSISPTRTRNGGHVTMRGRVGMRQARRPTAGKLVEIQWFDHRKRKWRPVKLIRANDAGRFSYHYRFQRIAYPQRIVFRAAVVPEGGWPYAFGASRARPVLVYPR